MAVLETLEGDTMEPEILNSGAFGANMARASLKAWEPTMADVLHRKPKRPALTSGIPAKLRATAANKATATRRPVRRIPARGAAGARPWGGSSGRFVMVGDEFDPESLEGWLTSAKKGVKKAASSSVKGVKKAASAVGSVGSSIVRPVASVGMNVVRSVAAPAGTLIGSAVGSAFGTSQTGSSLMSMFGMGGGSTATAPGGTPAAMPATGGGIPPIYLIGGGALMLVLLLLK